MSTIVSYFSTPKSANKRPPSDSSESTSSPIFSNPASVKPDKKKARKESETEGEEEMEGAGDLSAVLAEIREQLANVCTKDDFASLKSDFVSLSERVNQRLDRFESQFFDMQVKQDKLSEGIRKVKEENAELRAILEESKRKERTLERAQNDLEQHGRLWNVRVYGVKEAASPSEETAADCVKKCLEVFNGKLGVTVQPGDVEVAHRSGPARDPTRGASAAAAGRPRPVLLRFFSRQKKTEVLQSRRKLKQTGISVSEDLTLANYKLLKQSSAHSATMSTWSSYGKVITKLKNGKILRLDIGISLEELFRREM